MKHHGVPCWFHGAPRCIEISLSHLSRFDTGRWNISTVRPACRKSRQKGHRLHLPHRVNRLLGTFYTVFSYSRRSFNSVLYLSLNLFCFPLISSTFCNTVYNPIFLAILALLCSCRKAAIHSINQSRYVIKSWVVKISILWWEYYHAELT